MWCVTTTNFLQRTKYWNTNTVPCLKRHAVWKVEIKLRISATSVRWNWVVNFMAVGTQSISKPSCSDGDDNNNNYYYYYQLLLLWHFGSYSGHVFTSWGCQPHAKASTWAARVSALTGNSFKTCPALCYENCVLLSYYAASSCNSLPTFRNNLLVPGLEDGTDWLSRNVGRELPLLAT
jgi:hypothetical protein